MEIEILYQVNTGWLVVLRDLFWKCIFPLISKNKSGEQFAVFSSLSCCFPIVRSTRLFIDIIMGNFRQHEKIYFTSCSSWSNFESEKRGQGKVYRGKLFFYRYRCCWLIFPCGLWGTSARPPEFSTFSARCHHQFGCIREAVGGGEALRIEIQLWIFRPKSVGYASAAGKRFAGDREEWGWQ